MNENRILAPALQVDQVMMTRTLRHPSAALVAALVLLAGTFAASRLWFLNWGARASDRHGPLPGDEIVPHPRSQGTRAITIAAPAAKVWPWLAQTGQDRGGFHSYELLEDLAGAEIDNLPYLDPARQVWKVGNKLWMYPPHKLSGMGHAVLMGVEPGRYLAFGTRQIGTPAQAPVDGSWSFIVEPVGSDRSRLVIRSRAAGGLPLMPAVLTAALFDPAHYVMERRMMEVLKARAEGQPVSTARDNLQVVLWAVTFLAWLCAGVAIVLRRQPWRRLAVFLAAGLVFQLLTLTQPSPWLGVPLVLLVLLAGSFPRRFLQLRQAGAPKPVSGNVAGAGKEPLPQP
jgi:hypothetical protein